jgi:hypothetical protein
LNSNKNLTAGTSVSLPGSCRHVRLPSARDLVLAGKPDPRAGGRVLEELAQHADDLRRAADPVVRADGQQSSSGDHDVDSSGGFSVVVVIKSMMRATDEFPNRAFPTKPL